MCIFIYVYDTLRETKDCKKKKEYIIYIREEEENCGLLFVRMCMYIHIIERKYGYIIVREPAGALAFYRAAFSLSNTYEKRSIT